MTERIGKMFGYVKPLIPELKVKQHELYRAIYCSLCKRQKDLTGAISSFTLSYDFVFLVLMRSAITNDTFKLTDSHCTYNPLKKKKCIASCTSIDYTACAATLLTYYKLKDDVNDCRGLKRIKYSIACAFMLPSKNKAIKKYKLPENEIVCLLNELSEYEKSQNSSLDICADVFGRLLGVIAAYGIEDEMQSFVLDKCFYHIGRWIYIIDAVDDYPDDLKDGAYNPFTNDGFNKSSVDFTLQAILEQLDKYILKIKFSDEDIADIIKNIVYLGSDSVAKQVFQSTEDKLSKRKETNK